MTEKFSIIIPAYNEENRIGQTLRSISGYVRGRSLDCELIVVDDGSADGTAEVVTQELKALPGIRARLLMNGSNRGKGFSVRRGMLEAEGDLLLFTDADLSTPIEDFDKLRNALEEGFDVAIGSRAVAGARVEIHQNLLRETMGKIFNRIARVFTFRDISDSQCGFKAFKRQAAYDLFGSARIDGFSFDAEVLFLAQKRGYKVKEVPVTWRNSPASKVAILSDPVKMFLELFLIRILHFGHAKSGFKKN